MSHAKKVTWGVIFGLGGVFLLCLAQPSIQDPETSAEEFPVLSGLYLGQKPPGINPEIFALGIVCKGQYVLNAAFSPDGKEFFYSKMDENRSYTIMHMQEVNDRWTEPQIAPFSGRYSDADPFISPDGKTLFFPSNRPLIAGGDPAGSINIWAVNKETTGWGEPFMLESPINSDRTVEIYPSVSRNGTLYFSSDRKGGRGSADIYRSKRVNGHYLNPENLGKSINSEYREFDAYIAPDESFLIFSSSDRPDGLGRSDLYISVQKDNGKWTKAKNLGEKFNTSASEFTPMLSPDGFYFFFTSTRMGNADIFWMDARVLNAYKARK